jgi:hypothetical protein
MIFNGFSWIMLSAGVRQIPLDPQPNEATP